MSRAHRAIDVPGMREDAAMSVDRAAPDRRGPLRSRGRSSTGSRAPGADARTDRARARRAGQTGAGDVVKPTDRSWIRRSEGAADGRVDTAARAMPRAERRLRVREEALSLLREQGHMLPQNALADVVNAVSDAVVGMGPIEFLLKDPEVTEVMVNGPDDVYVERKGRIERVADRLFEGEEAVLHVIERIVAPLGLRVDATSPWVDARLPDGSRVQTRFLCALFRFRYQRLLPDWGFFLEASGGLG